VGAPTLGYDLARLPQGEQVAKVVRTALRCGPHDLEKLSARHPGPTRDDRWRTAVAEHNPGPVTAALPVGDQGLARAVAADAPGSAATLASAEGAMVGDLEALDRLIRVDILDWTWLRSGDLAVQDPVAARAADVLVDAAASGFLAASAPRPIRRMMAAPYLVARLRLVDAASGTGHPDVDRLLAVLGCADAEMRTSWRHAVDALRPGNTTWAPAMHQATWALTVADRLRLGLDAQMAAVAAFRAAGFHGRDAAYGVWNAVSGAVSATASADLLGVEDYATLMRVCRRVHGHVTDSHRF
jgi:hypothetical protein